MANFIQMFRSTDVGAPVLNGTNGSLLNVLDACLVNGYAPISVTSLTWSAGVASATIAANTTLRTGDRLAIAGAAESVFNGVMAVTVVSPTNFTYPLATAPSAATGSITYAKAGLGWSIPFTGTNKRAYRSSDGSSNRFYCRVEDNASVNVREAYVRAYEVMTDVDNGSELFPTVLQMGSGFTWNKSISADATARVWTLIGDGKTFYFYPAPGMANITACVFGFGHFNSFKPGDGFNTFITGNNVSNWLNTGSTFTGWSGLQHGAALGGTSGPGNLYAARGYTTLGSSIAISAYDGRATNLYPFSYAAALSGLPYPNPPSNSLWLSPIYCIDHTGVAFSMRGLFPGLYSSQHIVVPNATGDITAMVVNGVNALLYSQGFNTNNNYNAIAGMHYIDILGPW